MSDRAKEIKRMKKGKLMIESLSLGFFGIQPDSEEEEEEPRKRSSAASAGTSKAEWQHYEQANDVAMVDKDDSLQEIMMYPSGQAKGERFQATLDTGTPANWISREALQRLGIQPIVQAPTEWINFNGKTISSTEVVAITWNGIGSRKTRVTDFRVTPDTPFESAPFDVLIGRDLLFDQKILSLDNKAWIMAKKPATKEQEQLMEERRALVVAESKLLDEKRQAAALSLRQRERVGPHRSHRRGEKGRERE